MTLPWWLPFGRVDEIAPRDLWARLAKEGKELQILDVRERVEFGVGHIKRAKNVPIHDLSRRLGELDLNPEKEVIVVCLSGHRSIPAQHLLRQSGFRAVHNLAGGMIAWWLEKLPSVKSDDP